MSLFERWFVGTWTVILLCGCQQSTTDRKAEQIRNTSQRTADEIRERTQAVADEGERMADEVEAQGEVKADALEAAEDDYWRQNYSTRSYIRRDAPYEDYRTAYMFGWQAQKRYPGKTFDQVIDELEREWNAANQGSNMTWEEAQHPARDAWDHAR